MKLRVIKKVSADAKIEVDLEASSLKEVLLQASPLLGKDVCGKCQGEDITIEGSKAAVEKGGHIYIKRRCNNKQCNATSTLGTYKGDVGHFWNEWEIYQPVQQQQATPQAQPQQNVHPISDPPF